jgi:hypothetical protein
VRVHDVQRTSEVEDPNVGHEVPPAERVSTRVGRGHDHPVTIVACDRTREAETNQMTCGCGTGVDELERGRGPGLSARRVGQAFEWRQPRFEGVAPQSSNDSKRVGVSGGGERGRTIPRVEPRVPRLPTWRPHHGEVVPFAAAVDDGVGRSDSEVVGEEQIFVDPRLPAAIRSASIATAAVRRIGIETASVETARVQQPTVWDRLAGLEACVLRGGTEHDTRTFTTPLTAGLP